MLEVQPPVSPQAEACKEVSKPAIFHYEWMLNDVFDVFVHYLKVETRSISGRPLRRQSRRARLAAAPVLATSNFAHVRHEALMMGSISRPITRHRAGEPGAEERCRGESARQRSGMRVSAITALTRPSSSRARATFSDVARRGNRPGSGSRLAHRSTSARTV